MKKNREKATAGVEFDQPPFLYEIRVRGRLSAEQWASWFDGLTVSTTGGESTLRGRVPDHAALYGLLARLRGMGERAPVGGADHRGERARAVAERCFEQVAAGELEGGGGGGNWIGEGAGFGVGRDVMGLGRLTLMATFSWGVGVSILPTGSSAASRACSLR